MVSPEEEQFTSFLHPFHLSVAEPVFQARTTEWSGLLSFISLSSGRRPPKCGWIMALGPDHPCVTKLWGCRYPMLYNKDVTPRAVPYPQFWRTDSRFLPGRRDKPLRVQCSRGLFKVPGFIWERTWEVQV